MAQAMTPEELAALSDEELMALEQPPELAGETPPQEAAEADPEVPPEAPQEAAGETAEEEIADDAKPAGEAPDAELEPDHAAAGDAAADSADAAAADPEPAAAEPAQDSKEPETPDAEKPAAAPDAKPETAEDTAGAVNYEEAYKKIMAPFKANGKMVELRSPEEVIQLLQKGADYTKKLQTLQPQRKLLKMLENNQLLDEDKLTFLIDVSRKDPEAIKKLVKDSGLDPLDLETGEDPKYVPGNHSVSDSQMTFESVLEETVSTEQGSQLVIEINKTWDDSSKKILAEDPTILSLMRDHKEQGLYDEIASEVERQRLLGQNANVPFIRAYHDVGRQVIARKTQQTPPAPEAAPAASPAGSPEPGTPVATRTAARQAPANGDKAKAASATKSTPAPAKQAFNPLSMSDEEFDEHMKLANRL